MRRSVSEAALAQQNDPMGTDSLKNLTLHHDLSHKGSSETLNPSELSLSAETLRPSKSSEVNFLLGSEEDAPAKASEAKEEQPPAPDRAQGVNGVFPKGFLPQFSQDIPQMPLEPSPIAKNPFMSPLLAPDSMLQTLPPLHIVVSCGEGGQGRAGPREWTGGAGQSWAPLAER